MEGATKERRRRADGERSREKILQAAAELATIEGLNGLSIGRLAEEVGMSKSGLYAHFRSKEELQLATVETASRILTEELEPASRRRRAYPGSSRSATRSSPTSSAASFLAAASSRRPPPS